LDIANASAVKICHGSWIDRQEVPIVDRLKESQEPGE
jgi:hypothetical protein